MHIDRLDTNIFISSPKDSCRFFFATLRSQAAAMFDNTVIIELTGCNYSENIQQGALVFGRGKAVPIN